VIYYAKTFKRYYTVNASGLCRRCEMVPADHRCDRCETPVCRSHFDWEMGFCVDCAAKAKPDDRRGDTFRF
jgi:hypothetical protein